MFFNILNFNLAFESPKSDFDDNLMGVWSWTSCTCRNHQTVQSKTPDDLMNNDRTVRWTLTGQFTLTRKTIRSVSTLNGQSDKRHWRSDVHPKIWLHLFFRLPGLSGVCLNSGSSASSSFTSVFSSKPYIGVSPQNFQCFYFTHQVQVLKLMNSKLWTYQSLTF